VTARIGQDRTRNDEHVLTGKTFPEM
jgi:hypothetical protein